MYYEVENIIDRRVKSNDGSLEYRVHWKGYDEVHDTWEPRGNMAQAWGDAVQAIDQKQMEATDDCVARWRQTAGLIPLEVKAEDKEESPTTTTTTTACASPPAPAAETELLCGLLLSRQRSSDGGEASSSSNTHNTPNNDNDNNNNNHSDNNDTNTTSSMGSIVMLGELIMSEDTVAALGQNQRRKRTPIEAGIESLCAPARHVEKTWRDSFGVSVMHSCAASERHTLVSSAFTVDPSDEVREAERQLAGDLRIVGIAPPESTVSGAPYTAPVSFIPWVGEEEAERLRRDSVSDNPSFASSVQELLKPQREQLVVRYIVTEAVGETAATASAGGGGEPPAKKACKETVASMPMSVFRLAFPQILLDYLLDHSVVMEGSDM